MPILDAIEALPIGNPLPDATLSDEIATTFSFKKGHRISFEMMLQALAIPKDEIKRLSTAQKQTQFDYVKQRISEQTGEIWEWKGAPKDGEWVKVDEATIAAPSIEKSLNGKGLSDAIAATVKPKSTKKQSTKSNANRRFTLQEAVDFYNSAHPRDRLLKANSLKQNAKMYGFMIKERGSGMYALIDS